MRKCAAWLLALTVLLFSFGAYAEETFIMAGYDGGSASHTWETNLFFERMTEKTGISFTFRQYTDAEAWTLAKSDYLAGAPLPDVLFKAELTTQETMALYNAGLLVNLADYMQYAPNLSALLEQHPEWAAAITMPDGSIPALPCIDQLQYNNAMWINRAWLDALQLEMPTTAEELTQVLRAFRDGDPNQNGKADEIPLTFTGMWDLRYLAHAFGIIANDYNVYVDENGIVQTQLTGEDNRRYLEWMHMLWSEGLINHDGFTTITSIQQVTDEEAPPAYGVLLSPTPLSLVASARSAEYELLMPLRYNGRQVYRDLTGDIIRGTFAITTACSDPAALMAWVDHLYTEDVAVMMKAGVEGTDYLWNSDGTWSWVLDLDTVSSEVMPNATIAGGGTAPGLVNVAFQKAYDDSETNKVLTALEQLHGVSTLPYPQVWLTQQQRTRIAALHGQIGPYAEEMMVHFITGDVPLNDETWNEFCTKIEQLGMSEMIALWQEALS